MRSHDAMERENDGDSRRSTEVAGDVYQAKWTSLGAAALGFVLFELFGLALEFVASAIDGALYINVNSSVREVFIRYRVWELYRGFLYSLSAGFSGWAVARVFRFRQMLAITSVVIVIGASLLISLFTGPGYYLGDLAIIAVITGSPFIGGIWFQHSRSGQPTT